MKEDQHYFKNDQLPLLGLLEQYLPIRQVKSPEELICTYLEISDSTMNMKSILILMNPEISVDA